MTKKKLAEIRARAELTHRMPFNQGVSPQQLADLILDRQDLLAEVDFRGSLLRRTLPYIEQAPEWPRKDTRQLIEEVKAIGDGDEGLVRHPAHLLPKETKP